MFWTILLYVYLAISALTIILAAITINEAKTIYLSRHGRPLVREKSGPLFGAIVRMVIGCCTPIFHLVLFVAYTFMSERVVETAVRDLEKKWCPDEIKD